MKIKDIKYWRRKLRKSLKIGKKHIVDIIVFSVIMTQWTFAGQLLAYSFEKNQKTERQSENNAVIRDPFEVVSRRKIFITAYSSTPDQTDMTPCITASGFDLCSHNEENIIAANFLRFGTKARIPKFSGDKIYIVQDRMNARYPYRLDVWMKTREKAKKFGAQYLEIEILK